MTHFQLRLSVPHPPVNYLPDIQFWPLTVAAELMHYSSAVKKPCFSFSLLSSFRHKHLRPLQCVVGVSGPSGVDIDNLLNDGEAQAAGYPRSGECSDDVDHKEIQRRRRIALANKGNVPWNKGRQHTEETRLRIRQRTKEALKNPKIRKKMASHPLPHSDQSKENIRKSLRRVWAIRRKRRQLGESFVLSWMGSISEAARKGLTGQDELNWDSYEQIHQEMALQELQRVADKDKAKEMAKLRIERAAAAPFVKSWMGSISEAARKGLKGQDELNWDSYELMIHQEMALQELQRAADKEKAKEMAKLRVERAAAAKAEKLAMLARKREEREAKAKAKAKKELKRKIKRAAKEKAKEMAKQWVERAAAAKAEKLAMLASKRK